MSSSLQSGQPLYDVVRRGILERLRSGEWGPGSRLPTEGQLAEQFSVSVGTVRKAVEDLVAQRVLIRRARLGTTVALHTDEHVFGVYFNFFTPEGEKLVADARLVDFAREAATQPAAARLGAGPREKLLRIRNLRSFGDVPVRVDELYLSATRFAGLDADTFTARPGSIYGLYQIAFGITVVRIQEELAAVPAPAAIARLLKLPKDAPVLAVERTAYTFGDDAVEFRRRYVNTALCRFRSNVGLRE